MFGHITVFLLHLSAWTRMCLMAWKVQSSWHENVFMKVPNDSIQLVNSSHRLHKGWEISPKPSSPQHSNKEINSYYTKRNSLWLGVHSIIYWRHDSLLYNRIECHILWVISWVSTRLWTAWVSLPAVCLTWSPLTKSPQWAAGVNSRQSSPTQTEKQCRLAGRWTAETWTPLR